jgi:signal transduction histidine kinase
MREEEVSLTDLLDHAVTRFRSAHPDRPIEAELPERLATVVGDPVLLRRLVENLLENAHKYTDRLEEPIALRACAQVRGQRQSARRRASVRKSALDPAQPGVEIEIADRGVGIAPADLPRVCEPFFRADRSRTRATGGLGLGLALARRIVDAHDGELEITSKLGEGTSVRVWIPAREPDDRPSA